MSLAIKNLMKQYGDKVVVDDISFEINQPGVYALLGTNGAGKTTTLRIVLGILAHDGGQVLWDGKPLDTMKTNVGYLAEERGLYPKYSLLDQLLYFAKLKNVPKKLAMQRVKDWSEKLQVSEYVFPEKKGKGM
jgi:ABC-2 type transport system ATP-binding protein